MRPELILLIGAAAAANADAAASAAAAAAGGAGCYKYDTDILGEDLNFGPDNKMNSADLCQSDCQSSPDCNFWVWVSPEFFDPYYRWACWHKGYITEVLSREGVVTGPRECPQDQGECCTQIEIISSFSSGASFDQGERLGEYKQGAQMADGKYVYEQVEGNQYLYYMQDGFWMVGDVPGVNNGGIINYNTGQCPEEFTTPWLYWSWTDEWEEDDSLEAVCDDGAGGDGGDGGNGSGGGGEGDHEYEECSSGVAACGDCLITSVDEGTLFCCSVDCDYGGIETGSENGVPTCRCWHD